MSGNPSILSHVSLGTNQLDRALAFYDKALGALGIGRVVDLSQEHHAVAYGRAYPEFWVQAPFNGQHLHVLGTPPAFVLSQDQTLIKKFEFALITVH